jgi:HAD superfamily hydrolase (TIGR01509 family)
MKVIEAVILDMDGIVVDSEPLQLESFNEVLSQYGITLTEDDFVQLVGKTQPEIFTVIKNKFGISEAIGSLMVRKKESYLRLAKIKMKAMPGLYELVDLVKSLGIKTGIASSSPLEDIKTVLHYIHLEGEFDAILSAVNLPHGKPHPDVFLLTAKELGVEPSQCVVLEDSTMGVEAAKRASMVCIAMPNSFTKHQDFSAADFVVGNLFEAKGVLESLV